MADKEQKNETPEPSSTGFDPKPMRLGGESIADRLIPHMKKIVIGTGVVVVVISVVFLVRELRERGRMKDTAKLVKVLEVAEREVRAANTPPDPNAKEPTFADHGERATAILETMAKQGADGGAVFRGSLLVRAGKLDEAIAEYKKARKAKGIDGVLAREGLGIALETKASEQKDALSREKGLEEALAVFQAMQPDEKGPRYGYALYHQGRIHALIGRMGDARAMFEKAKASSPGSELETLIDERLAALGAS